MPTKTGNYSDAKFTPSKPNSDWTEAPHNLDFDRIVEHGKDGASALPKDMRKR